MTINQVETSRQPMPAKLVRELSLRDFGGDTVVLEDINNDGELEIVTLQTPGQFGSKLMADRSDIDDIDRQVFCMTAIDLSGNILWQIGEPYGREFPYNSHGVQGGYQMPIVDLDGDGKLNILAVRGSELIVVDAATGQIKRSALLPADNFMMVATAQLGPHKEGRQILCKVNDLAYDPWDYANPMVVFNHDLSVRHEPFAVRGAGHNFVIGDYDNDGRDEIFAGYSLLDHDTTPIWTLDLGEDFDYAGEHADNILVADINDDGELEVCYAGSEDYFVCDMRGNILWSFSAGHSQQSIFGKWPGSEAGVIVMAEKNAGLSGINPQGRLLWNRTDINGYTVSNLRWPDSQGTVCQWGVFRPQRPAIEPAPYYNDPSWSRSLWPKLMDATGAVHDFLPWAETYAHPRRWLRSTLSYDCGLKYYPVAVDFNGDGVDNMIVYNRDRLWIFTAG